MIGQQQIINYVKKVIRPKPPTFITGGIILLIVKFRYEFLQFNVKWSIRNECVC